MSNVSVVERKSNRLIREKSPDLLQHNYNPVDWYSWSYEVLLAIRARILLASSGFQKKKGETWQFRQTGCIIANTPAQFTTHIAVIIYAF